ncbi:hypothetical protein KPH14_009758 [Odynerus spinipes]|uniref:Uncharacterized protein n=1 Tax=Odynerus spinipes TaxID=1348599 RepID=A0AAD9RFT7_9HYME|nr:hypothetical protein KPH14_009758 [Odynerus spinipes]
MKKLVRSAIVYLAIIFTKDIVYGSNVVSTKIDLDSNEIQETSCDDSPVISKETERTTNVQKEPILRIGEQHRSLFHRNSQSFFGSTSPEDLRRRGTHLSGTSINGPNIVNNVRIFVNGNETGKGSNVTSCENGVCDVSVSSKTDEEGNIVTDVHVTIITNPKPSIEVVEIPVIDGFRGVEENPRHVSRPVFHSFDRARPTFTHIIRNDIPQVQSRGFQESNNRDVRFQNRRTYSGAPPPAWYNPRNHEPAYRTFQDSRSWFPRRVIVDDKIETPLSKTKYSDE